MCLFELLSSLSICPEVGLLGHMVALFFIFLMKPHTVFHGDVVHIYNRTLFNIKRNEIESFAETYRVK